MDLKKYCLEKDKLLPENKDKVVITNESYALIEMLNELAFKIGRIGKNAR